ncbi:hypothetical protein [Paenibacillus spongiae]|uniref:Peptidase M14 domain-containing protein n=1 Tax=Paenibacillus spongiae TaxID=2909671 RepID=A0ABY5S4P9_9BACL|nr:hypothetical protein [Paenibacillus spongiae]UVI27298.1 hypothetical protein L1F29_17605 [Paenibacillus spongiae]
MNEVRPDVRIGAGHAGGNIRVVSIKDDRVLLEQDLRDTSGWWFYWNFSAVSARGATIRFEFDNGEVVGPWGPAFSMDGVEWRWLGEDSLLSRQAFTYTFREGGERVYFCFCLPYQLHHFERFYARIAGRPDVRRDMLTHSELLRPIPLLLLGNRNAERHIVFTARHHACESTPLYMLEGLLDSVLSVGPGRSSILDRFLVHYIPFMDIDGVENGDQGKSRMPHDHNRDYTDAPIYRSTAALMTYASSLRTEIAIDFHGPFKWGDRNDVPFFVKKDPPVKERIETLSGLLEQVSCGRTEEDAIRHSAVHDLGMGEDWNLPHGRGCGDYFVRNGTPLTCSFEFPYFGSANVRITADNSRRFGQDFARALELYVDTI